jgi:phosphatidylethanolamine-binding protein (PEBP) family uncharacterized protein
VPTFNLTCNRPFTARYASRRSAALLGGAAPLLTVLLLHACSGTADPIVSPGSAGQGGSGTAGSGGTVSSVDAGNSPSASGAGGSSGTGADSGGSGGETGVVDAGTPDGGGSGDASAELAFTVNSPAFQDNADCSPDNREACDLFPAANTALGGSPDVSPEIDWTPGPAGTLSYAIALHDLTFLNAGDPYTLWAMWNIPASATGLPAELPAGRNPGMPSDTTEQVSIRGDNGFTGSGACGNVYEFVLYALDTESFVPDDTGSPDDVEASLQASSSVLATTKMRARSDPDGSCTPNN